MKSLHEKWRDSVEEYKRNPTKENLEKSYQRFDEAWKSSYRAANAGAGRGFSSASDYKRKDKRSAKRD